MDGSTTTFQRVNIASKEKYDQFSGADPLTHKRQSGALTLNIANDCDLYIPW